MSVDECLSVGMIGERCAESGATVLTTCSRARTVRLREERLQEVTVLE